MPDTNMQTAYIWATELADTLDVTQAAQFANQINELLVKCINKDIESSGLGS